jgi:prophage regulatory protein
MKTDRGQTDRGRSVRNTPVEKKLYRMNELIAVVGRCRAAIYRDVRNQMFPKPIRLGPNSVAWLVKEVDGWLEQRAAERHSSA